MKQDHYRILIGQSGSLSKLISYRLAPTDGSLYISLIRTNKPRSHWTFGVGPGGWTPRTLRPKIADRPGRTDISYHSSGLIRYKHTSNTSICAEPLLRITREFCFGSLSVPDVSLLDPHEDEPGSRDAVFQLPSQMRGRVQFDLVVCPLDKPRVDHGLLACNVLFEDLFSLNVVVSDSPLSVPDEVKDAFVFLSPSRGLFEEPPLDRDCALVHFHQKITDSNEVIVYPPNEEGVYRAVFAVPMRIAPSVSAEFRAEGLSMEVLQTTRAYVRFQVRRADGAVLKQPVGFRSLTFDAEL